MTAHPCLPPMRRPVRTALRDDHEWLEGGLQAHRTFSNRIYVLHWAARPRPPVSSAGPRRFAEASVRFGGRVGTEEEDRSVRFTEAGADTGGDPSWSQTTVVGTP